MAEVCLPRRHVRTGTGRDNLAVPLKSHARWLVALMLLLPALQGVNYLVARLAPGVIAPNTLAALRWLFAGSIFCFLARTELWRERRVVLADWRHTLVLGALGMWICGAWVYLAGQTTSATNMALIYALSPILIALIAHFWLKEPFNWLQGCGVALALAGVLHVVLKGQWADLARVRFARGDAWIFAASVCWALFSILLKRWTTPLSATARLGPISFAGVLVLLPFVIWEAVTGPLPTFSLTGVGLAFMAALLPGYAAYLVYALLLRDLGAARVGVVLYLGPPYVAVMAWIFLGEPIHGYHVVGLALIAPGIYLVNRRVRTRRR
jgi:drug/metabolite transporter (DMT)-like permease